MMEQAAVGRTVIGKLSLVALTNFSEEQERYVIICNVTKRHLQIRINSAYYYLI